MKKIILLALASFIAFHALPSFAEDNDQDYIAVSAGSYDISGDDDAAQFGLEYRFAPAFSILKAGVRPVIGLTVTNDNAKYGYGGFDLDIRLFDNVYLTPNVAFGAYDEGSGKDLGGTFEFRSGIELAYQCKNKNRIGLAFNHISNAGIYDHNPGVQSLMLTYSIPLKY